MSRPARAAGPLGVALGSDGTQLTGWALDVRAGANPLVIMRRVAFVTDDGADADSAKRGLLWWATEHRLGQDADLIRQVNARRDWALAAMRTRHTHIRLRVRPQWRLAIGLGNSANPHEIGLSLHGTYGWPTIPGSTLKGLTRAWATRCGVAESDPDRYDRIFGLPRPKSATPDDNTTDDATEDRTDDSADDISGSETGHTAQQGTVCFLDALPLGGPVTLTRDVVTPHVQPYYRTGDRQEPPAEYHNPVPAEFLVISGGLFAIDLVGPKEDVEKAAAWCEQAIDELGVGGKTTSGYGYLTVEEGDEEAKR